MNLLISPINCSVCCFMESRAFIEVSCRPWKLFGLRRLIWIFPGSTSSRDAAHLLTHLSWNISMEYFLLILTVVQQRYIINPTAVVWIRPLVRPIKHTAFKGCLSSADINACLLWNSLSDRVTTILYQHYCWFLNYVPAFGHNYFCTEMNINRNFLNLCILQ